LRFPPRHWPGTPTEVEQSRVADLHPALAPKDSVIEFQLLRSDRPKRAFRREISNGDRRSGGRYVENGFVLSLERFLGHATRSPKTMTIRDE
jgi:hypothetical protein